MPAKFWNKTSIRYEQTTKIIELFLQDLKASNQSKFWLQSCNVCTGCCAIESVGGLFKTKSPTLGSVEFMSQADIMFAFIYSIFGRENLPTKPVVGIIESEIMDNLTFAINSLSTCKATSRYFNSAIETVEAMKESLNRGCAIGCSYLTDYNTGHYITLVNWDGKKFYAYDSWKDNVHCKKGGVLEEYEPEFFIKRIRHRFIEVENPK